MDLLDLYHAHDFSLAEEDNYEITFKNAEYSDEIDSVLINKKSKKDGKNVEKTRKVKTVPWEPYKAAVSNSNSNLRKGSDRPEKLPELIAYDLQKKLKPENNEPDCELITMKRNNRENIFELEKSEKVKELEKKIEELFEELSLKQKVNSELRNLLIASLNGELQGQVEALTEDKIQLAHRVDKYMKRLIKEDEEADTLRIDRDVWKCKFLAQSIRCDELSSKTEFLLKTLLRIQNSVKEGLIKREEAIEFSQFDFQLFFNRSPCEERIERSTPKYTNLTISCCKNCAGREIQLL